MHAMGIMWCNSTIVMIEHNEGSSFSSMCAFTAARSRNNAAAVVWTLVISSGLNQFTVPGSV